MYGILTGLVGVAPRSVVPNLVSLFHSFLVRCPAESKIWATEIVYAVSHVSPSVWLLNTLFVELG
jgi:hypothetical protein